MRARKGEDVSEDSFLKLHQEVDQVRMPTKHRTAKLALLAILLSLIIILSFIAGFELGGDGIGPNELTKPTPVPTLVPTPTLATPEGSGIVPPVDSSGVLSPIIGSSENLFVFNPHIVLEGLLAKVDLD